MSARVAVLRGRTSDRSAAGAQGAQALGEALAARLRVAPVLVGTPGPPRVRPWEEDLRDGRAAIAAAGAALEDALDAGAFPVLLASDCTIAMATLPALARREPGARVVWLDAHGDFNTPETTRSGNLCGMCLAAACGRWDGGFGGDLDPANVTLADARDLDDAEREELKRAGVAALPPAAVAGAVRGARVFVHVDLDVLDPDVLAVGFPAPHGLEPAALRAVLAELAEAAEPIGVEITAFDAPADAAERERLVALIADVLAPLMP